MPNWCDCELKVYGPKKYQDELDKFHTESEKNGGFLESFHPCPKEIANVSSPVDIVSEEEYQKDIIRREKELKTERYVSGLKITQKLQKEYIEKYGFDNWYDWCIKNWGTKWNESEFDIYKEDGKVFCTFQTAWAPPIAGLVKISEDFPHLTFKLSFWECGAGYKGKRTIKNGDVVKETDSNYRGHRGG